MDEFTIKTPRCTGSPNDERSQTERACYDLLERLGIAFDRVDHDAASTIPLCHLVEEVLGSKICKNLFLCNRQKTQYYLLLMDGDKVFKTKFLSKQLGTARLSFAEEADLEQYLHLRAGSASVLGLQFDVEQKVTLVIDQSVLDEAWFGCHPCQNTSTLRMTTADLLEILLPALHRQPIIVNLPEEDVE